MFDSEDLEPGGELKVLSQRTDIYSVASGQALE